MGLFTAQRIVAYHHGKLVIEAGEEGGTVVRLLLPGSRRAPRLPRKIEAETAREAA
jgi:signal transduction histidine kinase